MNKLELLAKLKQAYEVLNDILENGDTELPHISISYIETEYNKVYDEISQTNEDVLFITVKESDYSIGYSANIDYQDRNNGEIYTSGDIGYEWWNDKSLIQQYEKELNNDETRENEPPIKLKDNDTMDKLVDMVMSERQQENDEIEME